MAIRNYKPTSAGRRGMSGATFQELTASSPEKSLLKPLKRISGRNSDGRITIRHRGGGHKRRYRQIDFKRNKFNVPAKVSTIEYDPNRNAHIALLSYLDGEKRYIVAPEGLQVGMTLVSSESAEISVGNTLPLSKIPIGTVVHCVELFPQKGAQLARSAGSSVQLMARNEKYAQIKLKSGEIRKVLVNCLATIGLVGNSEYSNIKWGKAGRKRWKGFRPTVRGVVMNPVDHPHGGGEGRTSGGRHPVTPWGVPTKGYKTRKVKRTSKYIIRSRHKK